MKYVIFAAVCGVAAPLASAQTGDDPVAAVYGCAVIESADERLACYDDAVGRLKSAEEAGEVTTVTREEIVEIEEETFGLAPGALPSAAARAQRELAADDAPLDQVTFQISEIGEDATGRIRIVFDNGQVWRQTDTKAIYISSRAPPREATIKRGFLGSFSLKLDNGRSFRAAREG